MIDDERAIRGLIEQREAAIARSDADRVLAAYADDVVLFDLAPPLRLSGAGAKDRRALQAWFDTWRGGVTVSHADLRICIDGDLAVAWGLTRLNGVAEDDGRIISEWSRYTVVLARRDREWRIIHEHSSYPLRMDGSGLAAVDLEP